MTGHPGVSAWKRTQKHPDGRKHPDGEVWAVGERVRLGVATRTIMWFRRDLRLGDHPAILAAAADGAEVVPVFVVDPTFDAAGAPRRAFLHDCLTSLDASLREASGTGLVIRHGDPTHVIPALAEELDADSVVVSRDYSPYGRTRDAAVADALTGIGRKLRGVGSPYAVDPGTVRKGDGDPYAVFTPFSKVWRRTGWHGPHEIPGADVRWAGAGSTGIDSDGSSRSPRSRLRTAPSRRGRPHSTGGAASSTRPVPPTARCDRVSTPTTTSGTGPP